MTNRRVGPCSSGHNARSCPHKPPSGLSIEATGHPPPERRICRVRADPPTPPPRRSAAVSVVCGKGTARAPTQRARSGACPLLPSAVEARRGPWKNRVWPPPQMTRLADVGPGRRPAGRFLAYTEDFLQAWNLGNPTPGGAAGHGTAWSGWNSMPLPDASAPGYRSPMVCGSRRSLGPWAAHGAHPQLGLVRSPGRF